MDSYEINKILGALLFTCLCLLSLNIAAGAMFAPHKPAKPGFEVAVTEQKQDAAGWRARAAGADREAARQRDGREGRGRGQEVRRLPYLRQGRAEPRRAEPVRRGRARARLACGIQLFGRHEGQARQVDDRGPQRLPAQSEGLRSRHLDDLCGLPRGSERADVIAYLNSKSDNPAPLPKAAEAPAAKAAQAPAGTKTQ